MKGQGTETLNSRTYDLRNMRLKSKTIFSSWAPLDTPPFLLYFRDGGQEA